MTALWHSLRPTLAKMTTGAKAEGCFGKFDFIYIAPKDAHRCPAGERLTFRYASAEKGRPSAAIGQPGSPAMRRVVDFMLALAVPPCFSTIEKACAWVT
jgi:hypothetical protein